MPDANPVQSPQTPTIRPMSIPPVAKPGVAQPAWFVRPVGSPQATVATGIKPMTPIAPVAKPVAPAVPSAQPSAPAVQATPTPASAPAPVAGQSVPATPSVPAVVKTGDDAARGSFEASNYFAVPNNPYVPHPEGRTFMEMEYDKFPENRKSNFAGYFIASLLHWITGKEERFAKYDSSDLIIKVNEWPMCYRKQDGGWIRMYDAFPINETLMEDIFQYLTPEKVKKEIVEKNSRTGGKTLDSDFACALVKNQHFKAEDNDYSKTPLLVTNQGGNTEFTISRYRVNLFGSKNQKSFVFRTIPSKIPEFKALGLPEIMLQFIDIEKGIIFVTGPTGSGKSTTLAAILNEMNKRKAYHVVTMEDPIEFSFPNNKCIFSQREVWVDTDSFAAGLKSALREHPNVILIGEMRDLETMREAMTAAETGHLVVCTLHTFNASKTIDRIVSQFPEKEQPMIQVKLSSVFIWAISQNLLKTKPGAVKIVDGKEKKVPIVALNEVIRANDAVRGNIKKGNTGAIPQAVANDKESLLMDDHAVMLIEQGLLDPRDVFCMFYREDKNSVEGFRQKLKAKNMYKEEYDPERMDEDAYKLFMEKKNALMQNGITRATISKD